MKATKEQVAKAAEIASKCGANKVFVNKKGEYFTNENYAAMSVGGSKEEYCEIVVTPVAEASEPDLAAATAEQLIAAAKAATESAQVQTILDAEKAGKGRKTVLEACDAKLKELETTES